MGNKGGGGAIYVDTAFFAALLILFAQNLFADDQYPINNGNTPAQTKQLLQKAQSSSDPESFWTDYFAKPNVDPAVIHEAVRRLSKEMQTKKENADQIIALIEAAILSGNAQPWMYEALALTLYFKDAPKKQILRAALSAADFCNDPIDLLNVGFMMRTVLGLKKEAFPLYQQALENMVPKREFYASTLRLAEELFNEFGDEESIRWICLAALSQEWDGALGGKLTQDANDMLMTLGNRMIKQGRSEDAKQLAQEIREAKLRDCIVTVEWTGDAGVDLMVREPTDSYCWFKNPRSISGGLLKTSSIVDPGKTNGIKKVSYICPKGFSGTYSLVLHKSWGNLANNLVKVAVETNVVPGEKGKEGTAIPMEPEGIVVNFALESGRRTESIAEGELAVADLQMSVAQQMVNRNTALWRLADDGLLGQAAGDNSDNGSPSGGGMGASPVWWDAPFIPRQSVIAYQPVIGWLEWGISLESNAIVSPDKRYVRMTPYPMVRQLRSFYVYNVFTGEISGGGQAQGGGGGIGDWNNREGSTGIGNSSNGSGSYGGGSSSW